MPRLVRAEGQYALDFALDAIDFIKVFIIWAVLVLFSIKILNYIKVNKLSKRNKTIIWLSTGLVALFIWSMIKHDSRPYEGPIDSIFNKMP
ncbi:hypothetical protein DNU06_17395 [Putridiphycobacter roseus]|uniref:Uncharacterized protein n=2 Tax=Putridiphycobacter roseus TaxID=2219161 RepID=A0A2W1MYE3_9FLAO|nr:hypothetical protein DNU06_17395 [Putridiphycobacter roseus]